MDKRRTCFYCGKPLSRQTLTRDHVRPTSKGGSDSEKNKVDSCRRCNEEKGCLTLEEYRAVHAYRAGISVSQFRFHGELESGHVHPASDLAKPSKKKQREQRRKEERKKKKQVLEEEPKLEISMEL